jgi:hypothetical protein
LRSFQQMPASETNDHMWGIQRMAIGWHRTELSLAGRWFKLHRLTVQQEKETPGIIMDAVQSTKYLTD